MSFARAVRIEQTGGPEVLNLVELAIPPLGPHDVLIRQVAIGVNYIDTYHRSGLYPVALPSGLGIEGAGVVEAIGSAVTGLEVGQRVAHCTAGLGAYADRLVVNDAQLVPVPDAISSEVAAAVLVKGLTAQMLLRRVRTLQSGETILLHAAAGGVGLIAAQWAKHLGAIVIGVVGSENKVTIAKANGCDHVIVSSQEDIAARVRDLTGGEGVPVVYDSVGRDTLEASLDSLAPLGLLVSFGNASGPPPPIDLGDLMRRGSLFVTRPTFATYVRTRELLHATSAKLFDLIEQGVINVSIGQQFSLVNVRDAHWAIESRTTQGATILIP